MLRISSDFIVSFFDNIIVIIDLDMGNNSVTSDIENVIPFVLSPFPTEFINTGCVIYRDSMKIYTQIIFNKDDNTFMEFKPLQAGHDLWQCLMEVRQGFPPNLVDIYSCGQTINK